MARATLVSASAPQPQQQPQQPGVAPSRPITPLKTDLYNQAIQGSIDSVRQEIDDAFADMKQFHQFEPDQVMRMVMGHTARLSEIKVRIMRIEDFAREWKPIRVREVEPALEELDRQYTIASRLHSVRELDWKIEAGER